MLVRVKERVADLLNLFLICAARASRDARGQEVVRMLDVLQDTIIELYAKLWTVRDSFLLGKCATCEDNSAMPYTNVAADERDLRELHDVLNLLGKLTVDHLKEYRYVSSDVETLQLS